MNTNEPITDSTLYDMLTEVKQAMTFAKSDADIDMPDVDEAWKTLAKKYPAATATAANSPVFILHSAFRKYAAIIAAIILIGGISYAAIHTIDRWNGIQESGAKKTAITPDTSNSKAAMPTVESPQPAATSSAVFENVTLETVMKRMADTYQVGIDFKDEGKKQLRIYLQWEEGETLQDIINRINHFDKVHLTLKDQVVTIE